MYIYIYIHIYMFNMRATSRVEQFSCAGRSDRDQGQAPDTLRPVHLLIIFLLRVLESSFPGDSL